MTFTPAFRSRIDSLFGNSRWLSGIERDFSMIDNIFSSFPLNSIDSNYPPSNIILDNGKTIIELAVAGFEKEEISLVQDNYLLKISGNKLDGAKSNDTTSETSSEVKPIPERIYVRNGIGFRSFTLDFRLQKNSKVGEVTLKNGILKVVIEPPIEEKESVKKIPIL